MKFRPKIRPFRQEHYRWMREGVPNFDDRIFQHIKELEVIAKKDVKRVSPITPIMRALEEMARSYRSLVVTSTDLFAGLVTVMKVVNYLGGGDLFQLVERKHKYNIYSALNRETVESITEKNPVVVYVDESIREALMRMIVYGAGILPVLKRSGEVYGIVTEHDFVKYLAGTVSIGLRARDCMSSPVITVNEGTNLKKALETMVHYGFRRLPVVNDEGVVSGIITAVDIVKGFGTHDLIERSQSGDIREVLALPITNIMVRDVAIAHLEDDLAHVVNTMLSRNVSSVLVIDEEGVLKGIVTERDVLYAILAPK
ncbi:MAG: CBS domain-containing protein [Desulfurococcaceae archaeon]